jgi:radical SAM enzyme (TIGR01210 family)
MCAHALQGTTFGTKITVEDYVSQFQREYEQQGPKRFPIVCIYNEGNMFFDGELPAEALSAMLGIIREYGVAKSVILESRTEYITSKTLEPIRKAIGPSIEIEVGIGFESVNDFIRNIILQKATSLRSYERSVRVLREHGFKSLAYVLVKPPFLTEAQALTDTVETGKYAFEIGVDVISLEPTGVEPYTIVQALYDWGEFTPPSLWTVLEATKRLAPLGEVRIGGLQFAPIPPVRSRTCDDDRCVERVLAAIRQYNMTYDIAALDSLDHKCREAWQSQIAGEVPVIDGEALAGKVQEALQKARVAVPINERFINLLKVDSIPVSAADD